jgi:hypothetical protein
MLAIIINDRESYDQVHDVEFCCRGFEIYIYWALSLLAGSEVCTIILNNASTSDMVIIYYKGALNIIFDTSCCAVDM